MCWMRDANPSIHTTAFPLGSNWPVGIQARQALLPKQGRGQPMVSYVSVCLNAWVTQLWSWRPAKLAYCLALFAFRAMVATE